MLDRTNCLQEQVHLPGAVMAGGVLLCVQRETGLVVQCSANVGDLVSGDVLGLPAVDVLGPDVAAVLVNGDASSGHVSPLLTAKGGRLRQATEVRTYRSGEHLAVAELRPAPDGAPGELPDAIGHLLRSLQDADSVPRLLDLVARGLREMTGYDRVWAYRFEPDDHGVIVAEDCGRSLPSFLGLHYPADDIPPQARALYLRNRVRTIPDVRAAQVPLQPVLNPVTGQALDQSDGMLRAVSPMHIRYLENMGVRAALSVAIAVEGRLWGLLSAHDYRGPRELSGPLAAACDLLSLVVSLQLTALLRAERARAAELAARHTVAAVEAVADAVTVVDGLAAAGDDLLAVCRAEGAVVRIGGS